MSEDEQHEALSESVRAWYGEVVGGSAVMTAFYIIATGTGFDDDGEEQSHVAMDWDASVIEQVGLIDYARRHAYRRINEEASDD